MFEIKKQCRILTLFQCLYSYLKVNGKNRRSCNSLCPVPVLFSIESLCRFDLYHKTLGFIWQILPPAGILEHSLPEWEHEACAFPCIS